ncbi:MAG: right-handed parallel beta-helix repeat-containing protein [Planctomycetes bacterium]|nr:right-handed parallel beta-helix repeat-containing protein [Planctomycetota bacterium]
MLRCPLFGLLLLLCTAAALPAAQPCFPGAVGYGIETPGGRGGKVLTVTTLAGSGPGSLREALAAKGPRIVVFAVGGVIDLAEQALEIDEPFVTVAGQTAPAPGITLIRAGLRISAHDVVLRHLRVRPGDCGKPKKSGWSPDGLSTYTAQTPGAQGPHDIVIDHCSFTWAVDENLSASGVRHAGRAFTSHRVTFSNNIIAEGLAQSTHEKGEHSKGTLIHDNAREIAILGNLYACNTERNPVLKPDAAAVIANNLVYNPAKRAIHTYWNTREYEGKMQTMLPATLVIVGNTLWTGPNTPPEMPFVFIQNGKADVYLQDNLTLGPGGKPVAEVGGNPKILKECPFWPAGYTALPAKEAAEHVLNQAGARPWDRDAIDERIVAGVRARTGKMIDSQEQVGGYPKPEPTRHTLTVPADPQALDAWLESFIPKS